ncbi:MAG: HPr family phosphocarrier protein [Oscillospiraceae bacterium]
MVKNFVSAVTTFECDFDIVAERYVVDAKSIMGIFSLDLSKPLALHINSDDEKEINDVLKAISAVLVSE